MDAEEYKRTATYGVFREDQLKETLQILKSQNAKEASVIEEAFHKGGLGIPITRDGVDEYPYYVVNCTEDEAYEILDLLLDAEGESLVAPGGGATPETDRIGRIAGVWYLSLW